MSSKVFVGNLDFGTTRDQLEALFAEIARPVDLVLPSDRTTGRPRGFAFVVFETAEQAQQAIARFNDHELDGRALRVNLAEDRPSGASSFRPGPPSRPKGSRRNLRARKRSL